MVFLELENDDVRLGMRRDNACLVAKNFFDEFDGLGPCHGGIRGDLQHNRAFIHIVVGLGSYAGQLFVNLKQLRHAAVHRTGIWWGPQLGLIHWGR